MTDRAWDVKQTGVEIILDTEIPRVELHQLGECLNPADIAGPEWGPVGHIDAPSA